MPQRHLRTRGQEGAERALDEQALVSLEGVSVQSQPPWCQLPALSGAFHEPHPLSPLPWEAAGVNIPVDRLRRDGKCPAPRPSQSMSGRAGFKVCPADRKPCTLSAWIPPRPSISGGFWGSGASLLFWLQDGFPRPSASSSPKGRARESHWRPTREGSTFGGWFQGGAWWDQQSFRNSSGCPDPPASVTSVGSRLCGGTRRGSGHSLGLPLSSVTRTCGVPAVLWALAPLFSQLPVHSPPGPPCPSTRSPWNPGLGVLHGCCAPSCAPAFPLSPCGVYLESQAQSWTQHTCPMEPCSKHRGETRKRGDASQDVRPEGRLQQGSQMAALEF
ncbi:lactosylceramide 4-alpha-galactosyltransferase isoform X2 [Marmota marmota marmota]|uniref:lactosylceramide 4-alpha-galactosyltransferase isoform X2 n=1 Tax=Marmota marmota marmota TaxID=9994 RepID=UPI002092E84A|nr:lactosylceramide 4-alpha-galactosyltransferase isoform X2 [Marmota marmota marmota]